ncbi:5775_t:CDS:1 [Funneliformis geosporum]|uniref:8593_t:CDS:1 n=1 Tax=Funneliformis geosporum TaxID=1117311 RepID=A0A9W4WR55_9GLOM|nr:8593_t:CDS:1 [Funneliformis geosporum]CAI2184612.1 5775_t:CDS:1 [Funneliformis geosporum]
MGSFLTKETFTFLKGSKSSDEKLFQVPIFKENDAGINKIDLTASNKVQNLLTEAERKMNSHEYVKSVEILQLAIKFDSSQSAAKLGHINLRGLNATIVPDYATSAAYYFIALKFIKISSHTKWELDLLHEVIEGLTELYRFYFNRRRDLLIWNYGIKVMKSIDKALKDPLFSKTLTDEEVRKNKSIRIHITFCLALTAELEGNENDDFRETVNLYHECEQIGTCDLECADKLVKKAHTRFRLLEPRVPRVQPVCVICNYKAGDLKSIWSLLVCSKCQIVACCSRKCLNQHSIMACITNRPLKPDETGFTRLM